MPKDTKGSKPPSVDIVWAARNWYVCKYLRGQKPERADAIGFSQATQQMARNIKTALAPEKPPTIDRAVSSDEMPLENALYPYERDTALTNQGIAYGESVFETLWGPARDERKLQRIFRNIRRTESGRQPDAIPAPNAPSIRPIVAAEAGRKAAKASRKKAARASAGSARKAGSARAPRAAKKKRR